jgi:hypothetical protein
LKKRNKKLLPLEYFSELSACFFFALRWIGDGGNRRLSVDSFRTAGSRHMRVARTFHLVVIAILQTHLANATSPVTPDMTVNVTGADLEAQRNQLRAAPVHLQALLLDGPPEIFPALGRCTIDASVIRVFKGADLLRAGSLFRLAIPCSASQYGRVWRDHEPVHTGYVFKGELKPGCIIEAYLDHFGPRLGYRLAGFATEQSTAPEERYAFLSAASVQPRLPVPPPGKPVGKLHFWVSGHRLEQAMARIQQKLPLAGPAPEYPALTLDPSNFEDRGQERPPAFPSRLVAQTVTHPDRPGRQYRILYDPDTWRTRVDEMDMAGNPTGLVQFGDAFSGMIFKADAKTHTASLLHLGGRHADIWLGAGMAGLSPVMPSWQVAKTGSKSVAGTPCTDYRLQQQRWNPRAYLNEGHICMTDAGLVLETNNTFFGTLAYVTVKVQYPDHIAASEFSVPQGWKIVTN